MWKSGGVKKTEFLIVLVVVGVIMAFIYRGQNDEPSGESEMMAAPRPIATATAIGRWKESGAEEVPWPLLKNLGRGVPEERFVQELEDEANGMEGTEEVAKLDMPEPTTEVLLAGRELYAANCSLCHGNQLLGDGEAGAMLDPSPTDLRSKAKYKYGHLQYAVYRSAAWGVEGTGMAPWGDILTPEELWAVTHYVVSMQDDPYGLNGTVVERLEKLEATPAAEASKGG